MKTIIYKSDGEGVTAVGNKNPLPVTSAFDSDTSFNVAFYSENASGGSLAKALTAGKSIYITDLAFSAEQAGSVWLYDSGGNLIPPINLGANGNFEHTFSTPIQVTEGADLWLKTDGAIHISAIITGYVA